MKSYLWKAIGVPSLTYGMNCVSLSTQNIASLESAQGTTIKHILGLSKFAHHTRLLKALQIPRVKDVIMQDTLNLASRICLVKSPLKSLFAHSVAANITHNIIAPGTLIHRLCLYDIPCIDAVFRPSQVRRMLLRRRVGGMSAGSDGLVDSLSTLLRSDDFNNRQSLTFQLFTGLTASW